MPGLLRGMARTAAVAGTATAVSNRVSRRQASRWSQQDAEAYPPQQQDAPQQYAAPPEPANGGDDLFEQLQKLGALHEQGILTDEEFAAQKAKLLA
jgi:Short C-terminal domain